MTNIQDTARNFDVMLLHNDEYEDGKSCIAFHKLAHKMTSYCNELARE